MKLYNDELYRHWVFNTEFQWEVLCNGDEDAQSISVIDVKGVSLFDLMGSTLDFVRKTISTANMHYPNRAFKVYIVNATTTFTTIFSLVKRVISAATVEKISVCGTSGILECLMEEIDIDEIPDYYGGNLRYDGFAGEAGNDSCRFNSPYTKQLNEFVYRIPGNKMDGFDHSKHGTVDDFKGEVRSGTLQWFNYGGDPHLAGLEAQIKDGNSGSPHLETPHPHSPHVQTFLNKRSSGKREGGGISTASTADDTNPFSGLSSRSPQVTPFSDSHQHLFRDSPATIPSVTPKKS